MDGLQLSEIAQLDPLRYNINIDVLILILIFFDFLPIVLSTNWVHLIHGIADSAQPDKVDDGNYNNTQIEEENKREPDPSKYIIPPCNDRYFLLIVEHQLICQVLSHQHNDKNAQQNGL